MMMTPLQNNAAASATYATPDDTAHKRPREVEPEPDGEVEMARAFNGVAESVYDAFNDRIGDLERQLREALAAVAAKDLKIADLERLTHQRLRDVMAADAALQAEKALSADLRADNKELEQTCKRQRVDLAAAHESGGLFLSLIHI